MQVEPLRASAPGGTGCGNDSPVNAAISSVAASPDTIPSTGSTSPCRMSSRSPGRINEIAISSSPDAP